MTKNRPINSKAPATTIAILFLFTACVSLAGDEKPKYDLPPEIQSLPESARPEPAGTVLDFDSTSAVIADTAKAVVWLRFKPNPQGEISDIGVVFSSHPNFGLEERAIEALKAAAFDPVQMFRKRLAKWLYYEVVFDRALFRNLASPGKDSTIVIDSTEYLPEPDEFVPVEQYPEMIDYGRPEYPRLARSNGVTGTVWVKSLIDRKGFVRIATVGKSSGNELLDKAAVDAGYKCRFKPAVQNEQPIACWVTYRVDFSLEYK